MLQISILLLIGFVWLVIIVISGIGEGVSRANKKKHERESFEFERKTKYGTREIDTTKKLFQRNEDIISKYSDKITSTGSRYYYIENSTRDCINEICLAEGRNDIKPNRDYLSNWRNRAPADWRELSDEIEKLFKHRQMELAEEEKVQEKIEQDDKLSKLKNKYKSLIDQFYEVAYRKVTTIDDYGEENWDSLEKEVFAVIIKIAKKEGVGDQQIKSWKKYSWSYDYTEYGKLDTYLTSAFQEYYSKRKDKVIKNSEIKDMSGVEFETYLADLLKKNGFSQVSGTKATGDQGADLIAKKNGKTIVIQAKRYEGSVGNKAVQEVTGAVHFYNGDEGWVITNSNFTKSAKELAHKNNIKLFDGHDLERFSEMV